MSGLDDAIGFAQEALSKSPVALVLGSGASVPAGLPTMGELAHHLSSTVKPDPSETRTWQEIVEALGRGEDFEQTIGRLEPEGSLHRRVIEATWRLVHRADRRAFFEHLFDRVSPLAEMLAFLTATSGRTLDVITTNYDRLAEYAAEQAGCVWFDGFSPGHTRNFVGSDARDAQWSFGAVRKRMVRIWKVHGSLDWFRRDELLLATAAGEDIPSGAVPLIVTPGRGKFEEAFREPFRTMLTLADDAMTHARTVLCLGYGFNDSHVQEKLRARRGRNEATFIVIARELTPRAREFLLGGHCSRFLAIEARQDSTGAPYGSKIYTSGSPLFETDAPFWMFQNFVDRTIGH